MAVYDRWHLARPPAGAKTCGKHKGKVPSAVHGTGLRWQVRGTDDRGRRVKFSFESFEEAGHKDAELKAAVKAGRYVDERAGKVTLRSRCELWLTTRTHDPVTRERVEGTFRNHVYEDPERPGITPRGGTAVGEISMLLLSRQPSRLKAWLAGLPLHDNTKCLLYDLIASVFKDAVHDHIIVESPFGEAVRRPKRVDREPDAWPAEVVAKVAAEMPGEWEAMPLLAAACGHRQAEAFAVASGDIDWLRRTCRIEAQLKLVGGRPVFAPIKNDKPRVVPVPSWTLGRLARHLELFPAVPVTLPWLRPDGRLGKDVTRPLLFARGGRRPLTRSAFNPHWRRAWKAAGVEDAEQINGFHVCRHSAASAWLSGGLNIAKVAAFLGDSVAVVSRTYAHFLPDDDERARGIMEAHFSALAERQNAPVVPRTLGERT